MTKKKRGRPPLPQAKVAGKIIYARVNSARRKHYKNFANRAKSTLSQSLVSAMDLHTGFPPAK